MMNSALLPQPTPSQDLDTTAPNPDELLTAWLAQPGLADNTRKAYRTDLACYFTWLSRLPQPQHPLAANRLVVDQFARYLEPLPEDAQERERALELLPVQPPLGLSRATRARRLAAVSSFYEYLCSLDLLVSNPVQRVTRPKVDQDSTTLGPSAQELSELREAARQAGEVDWCLVTLLGGLGLRVSEACAVDLADLGTQAGEGQVHRTVQVKRKGGKTQTLPLPPQVALAVDAARADRTEGPLLVNPRGERLTRHQAAYKVKRAAKRAGLDKALTPHGLRHGFVTTALANGAPLHRVQYAAGHADPRTTNRYDRRRKALDGHAAYTVDLAVPPAG